MIYLAFIGGIVLGFLLFLFGYFSGFSEGRRKGIYEATNFPKLMKAHLEAHLKYMGTEKHNA